MEMEKFFKELATILDKPKSAINEEYAFSDTDWDSLTVMAVAASVDAIYDVVIPVKRLAKCENVKQILEIINEEARGT